MNSEFFTVAKKNETSFIEKKSEFIGSLAPVKTTEEAVGFISLIKSTHKNAKHYVYAYILRENSTVCYSDDGEPHGKAAMPALEVLKTNHLTDICLVITRYFGGILLGGGGLARAYSKSAAMTVGSAEICHMVLCKSIVLETDYSIYDKLSFYFKDFSLAERNTEYSDSVSVYIDILNEEFPLFSRLMQEKSSGKCSIKIIGERFSDLPEKNIL